VVVAAVGAMGGGTWGSSQERPWSRLPWRRWGSGICVPNGYDEAHNRGRWGVYGCIRQKGVRVDSSRCIGCSG